MRESNKNVSSASSAECYARDVDKELIDSLDEGPADPDRDAAWDAELDRRSAEVKAGTVRLWTMEEANAYFKQCIAAVRARR